MNSQMFKVEIVLLLFQYHSPVTIKVVLSTPVFPEKASYAYTMTSYTPFSVISSSPANVLALSVMARGMVSMVWPLFLMIALTSYLFASHNPPGVIEQPHIITMLAFIGIVALFFLSLILSCVCGKRTSTANPATSRITPSPTISLPGISQACVELLTIDCLWA